MLGHQRSVWTTPGANPATRGHAQGMIRQLLFTIIFQHLMYMWFALPVRASTVCVGLYEIELKQWCCWSVYANKAVLNLIACRRLSGWVPHLRVWPYSRSLSLFQGMVVTEFSKRWQGDGIIVKQKPDHKSLCTLEKHRVQHATICT